MGCFFTCFHSFSSTLTLQGVLKQRSFPGLRVAPTGHRTRTVSSAHRTPAPADTLGTDKACPGLKIDPASGICGKITSPARSLPGSSSPGDAVTDESSHGDVVW